MTKPTAVLDIECYKNYFLVKFKRVDTGAIREYEMFDGQCPDPAPIRDILLKYRVVTFNGINYDMPMLTLALRLMTQATKGTITALEACQALKAASDAIIVGNLRSWQFEQRYDLKVPSAIDHIDLCEVAPGVMVSLKQYGGRMHSRKLQDLPIDPSDEITPEQRALMRDYCGNDLDTTIDLWHKLTDGKDDVIAIRELIGAESKLDLRSKSDAQMAEAVIRSQVEKLKGERIFKPEIPAGTTYKYTAPAFINFTTHLLRDTLATILAADFVLKSDGKIAEPSGFKDYKFKIGSSIYKIGIGGLHSTEKSVTHVADANTLLVDRDVVSFYPMLIKQCGLSPKNMGAHFQRIFSDFIARRIAAKKAGHVTTAQTLKIYLNGSFGKLGSRYSVLYAPDLLLQVTLTGQLVLLMMIEAMEAAGLPVVSANTDGIVIKCPRAQQQTMLDIVADWERATGFETEETRYRALCSRDINNYFALKEKGGYKAKGTFTAPGLMKNPQHEICNIAAAKFLEFGTPVAETILGCTDVRKFITVRNVTGGATYDNDYLGKVVRWVYARDETRCIRRRKPNKLGNHDKVAGSDGAMPLMELPDVLPATLDHAWYIREANDILKDVGALL
jgi:hypothetical protein